MNNTAQEQLEEFLYMMSKGNAGARTAMTELITKCAGEYGPYELLFHLKLLDIRGRDLYILWSDKCNRDHKLFSLLISASINGFYSPVNLKELSLDQMGEINLTKEDWDYFKYKLKKE